MTRRCFVTLLLVAVIASCNRGAGKGPGLADAGPPIADFVEAGKALAGLGAAVAAITTANRFVPADYKGRLKELGAAAKRILSRAEPPGRAGAAAIQDALAGAATEVITHLVMGAGGAHDGPNTLVSSPPGEIVFAINVPFTLGPYEPDRSKGGISDARDRLQSTLRREIEHFIYVALLADPSARNKLAPRRSPQDLPTVTPDLHLSVDTTQQWRYKLFDKDDRLVVPSQIDTGKWLSFQEWSQIVNPTVIEPVAALSDIAVGTLFT